MLLYLWVDAIYVRRKVGGGAVFQAMVTVIALGEDGRKHLVPRLRRHRVLRRLEGLPGRS